MISITSHQKVPLSTISPCSQIELYEIPIERWTTISHKLKESFSSINHTSKNASFLLNEKEHKGISAFFKLLTHQRERNIFLSIYSHAEVCYKMAFESLTSIIDTILWGINNPYVYCHLEKRSCELDRNHLFSIFPPDGNSSKESESYPISTPQVTCLSHYSHYPNCHQMQVYDNPIWKWNIIRSQLDMHVGWMKKKLTQESESKTPLHLIHYPILTQIDLLELREFLKIFTSNQKRIQFFSTCPIVPYSCNQLGYFQLLHITDSLLRALKMDFQLLQKGWKIGEVPAIFSQSGYKSDLDQCRVTHIELMETLNRKIKEEASSASRLKTCRRQKNKLKIKKEILQDAFIRTDQADSQFKLNLTTCLSYTSHFMIERSMWKKAIQQINQEINTCEIDIKSCESTSKIKLLMHILILGFDESYSDARNNGSKRG